MTEAEARIIRLEVLLKATRDDLLKLNRRLATAEQQARGVLSQMWQSDGDALVGSYWCRTPGSVSAATGTWPTITPTTFSATVYKDVSGTLTSQGSKTIYWWYKDTAAINKLVACQPNTDGSFDALSDSCTAV